MGKYLNLFGATFLIEFKDMDKIESKYARKD